jgi:hypothetical protein
MVAWNVMHFLLLLLLLMPTLVSLLIAPALTNGYCKPGTAG